MSSCCIWWCRVRHVECGSCATVIFRLCVWLSEQDLERCRVSLAEGVFILADQFSTHPYDDDAANMLTAISIKRFCCAQVVDWCCHSACASSAVLTLVLCFPLRQDGRDVPLYMQLNKLESKEHFLGMLPAGMDATIVCIEQVRANGARPVSTG